MANLPVADAGAQLSRLIDEVTSTHERLETPATDAGLRCCSPRTTTTRSRTPSLCTVDDDHRVVGVTAIRHRADAYRG